MTALPRLCIVEPWFLESHKALFEGIANHTELPCDLVTGTTRRWRWAMRTGAIHMAKKICALDNRPDVLLTSGYVNLSVLCSLCPQLSDIKKAVYFLENQLTYPTRDGKPNDFEFIGINLTTTLAADRVIFCSHDQKGAMLAALPAFLSHDSELDKQEIVENIEGKSVVIPIGVDLPRFDRARGRKKEPAEGPLRIVWPHRFEYDKNPEDFFDVIATLVEEGLEFELAVVGKAYREIPDSIRWAKKNLSDRIVRFGFLEGEQYADALASSDVVVSTAWQETQGIAVIEAIRAGCDPLVPDRLSYPEVLGPKLCEKHLYRSKGELRRRLRWMIRNKKFVRENSAHWEEMGRFGWETISSRFDELFLHLSQKI